MSNSLIILFLLLLFNISCLSTKVISKNQIVKSGSDKYVKNIKTLDQDYIQKDEEKFFYYKPIKKNINKIQISNDCTDQVNKFLNIDENNNRKEINTIEDNIDINENLIKEKNLKNDSKHIYLYIINCFSELPSKEIKTILDSIVSKIYNILGKTSEKYYIVRGFKNGKYNVQLKYFATEFEALAMIYKLKKKSNIFVKARIGKERIKNDYETIISILEKNI